MASIAAGLPQGASVLSDLATAQRPAATAGEEDEARSRLLLEPLPTSEEPLSPPEPVSPSLPGCLDKVAGILVKQGFTEEAPRLCAASKSARWNADLWGDVKSDLGNIGRGPHKRTPLMAACRFDNLERARLLIDHCKADCKAVASLTKWRSHSTTWRTTFGGEGPIELQGKKRRRQEEDDRRLSKIKKEEAKIDTATAAR
jgi:Ankyrin repeat